MFVLVLSLGVWPARALGRAGEAAVPPTQACERCSAAEAAIHRDRHPPERAGVSDDSERCRAWSRAAHVCVSPGARLHAGTATHAATLPLLSNFVGRGSPAPAEGKRDRNEGAADTLRRRSLSRNCVSAAFDASWATCRYWSRRRLRRNDSVTTPRRRRDETETES